MTMKILLIFFKYIFILYDYNSSFFCDYILNLQIFILILFDLSFYFDIFVKKNINYEFISHLPYLNFFFYLIT